MTQFHIYTTVGIFLWILGLVGLLLVNHVLRRVISVNIMSTGVFLILVAQADLHEPRDPVLQALVVTGLVVAVSATALVLRLANSSPPEHGPHTMGRAKPGQSKSGDQNQAEPSGGDRA